MIAPTTQDLAKAGIKMELIEGLDYEIVSKKKYNQMSLRSDKGAIQDYTKAMELNPNYADEYFSRGLAKANLQDYKGAI
jgi:tetratricopeptide (TPR) repeat protein